MTVKPLYNRSLVSGIIGICLVAACRDEPENTESERALRRRLERQAASRPPEASLRLGVIHHLDSDISAGGPIAFERSDTSIEIQEAYVVISAIEVHACEPGLDDYETPDDSKLLNDLVDWGIESARAHVPSSSTRLGTPFVEDLLAEGGRARVIGSIAPPLAAYCRLYAVIAPADRDVSNATSVQTEAIRGHSLLVRGRRRAEQSTDWESFELRTDRAMAVKLEAIDPRTGESPVLLDQPTSSAMLLIDKPIDPSLFEIDLQSDQAAEHLLERLTERFRLHTF